MSIPKSTTLHPFIFHFFNNNIIYLQLFNNIFNVENDNALQTHNFSPFSSSLILTCVHTRCSYGYHTFLMQGLRLTFFSTSQPG